MLNCTLIFIDAADRDINWQRISNLCQKIGARQAMAVCRTRKGQSAVPESAGLELVYKDYPLSGSVWDELLEKIITKVMVSPTLDGFIDRT